jgi:autotransporter-associated beta strand protein
VSSGATLDLNGQTGINASINLYGSGNNSGNGSLVNSNATTTAVLNGPSGVESAIVTTAFTSTAIPGTAAFTVTGGNGTGATAVPSLGLTPASFTVTSGTTTYKIPPTVTLSGGGGSGAIVTAVTNSSGNTVSTTLVITAPGFGYTTAPTVSFSGGTVLVAGTNPTISANANNFQLMGVQITAPGSGYTTPPVWTISGFTGSAIAVLNSLNLATSTAIGGPGNIVIGSPISGAGTLTNIGPGTVTLSAANTYTGGTLIKAGTLKLGDGVSNNGSVAGNITNNAALILANPLAQTYAGVISGTGTVTETGPGVMTLTGASTYTGATTVSAGTLSVGTGGSLAAGTSATVTTGGTLGVADGTINGSVAVNAGGTLLATGAASAINGATTVSGALSMVDGAIDTVTFGSSLALSGTTSMEVIEGSGFNLEDEIVMTSGTVTLGGTLTVTQIDANAFMLNDTFQLFSGTIAGSFTGINLPVLPAGLAWDKSGLKPGGSGYITVVSAPSAPQATAIASLPDGNFSLTVTGAVGQPFALYGTNNVAAPTPWTLLTNGTIPASSFTVYDLMATNYPQRFYYLTNTP